MVEEFKAEPHFSMCVDPVRALVVLNDYGFKSKEEVIDAVNHVLNRSKPNKCQ